MNRKMNELGAIIELDRSEHESIIPNNLTAVTCNGHDAKYDDNSSSSRCVVIEECYIDDDHLIGREKLFQLFTKQINTYESRQLDDKLRTNATELPITDADEDFHKRDFLGVLFNSRRKRKRTSKDKRCFDYAYHIAISLLVVAVVVWIVAMICIFASKRRTDDQAATPTLSDNQSSPPSTMNSTSGDNNHNNGFIFNKTIFQATGEQNETQTIKYPESDLPSSQPTSAPSLEHQLSNLNTSNCSILPILSTLPGKKGLAVPMDSEALKITTDTTSYRTNILDVINPYWTYESDLRLLNKKGTSDTEIIPMIVTDNLSELESVIRNVITPTIERGETKLVMGYIENGRDYKDETINTTVDRALEVWTNLESMNVSLISPSRIYPTGRWMKRFMKRITKDCKRVDYIGVQWNSTKISSNTFKRYMNYIYELYGKPLLITKISPVMTSSSSYDDSTTIQMGNVLQFMKEVIPWMERQEWIIGYAWVPYPNVANETSSISGSSSSLQQSEVSLFDESGSLTVLGEYYASVSNDNPDGNLKIKIKSKPIKAKISLTNVQNNNNENDNATDNNNDDYVSSIINNNNKNEKEYKSVQSSWHDLLFQP